MDSLSDPLHPVVDKLGRTKVAPRTLRERVAQFIRLNAQYPNATRTEIAERMGVARSQLYRYIKEGQEAGLLRFDDPIEKLENEIIPKVVDNLNYFLDAKDKTVTIETAKGTIFKQFQEARGLNENNQTVLALKIEQPDGQEIKIMTGHIVGRPKELVDPIVTEQDDES